jgi:copper homeostasis protein
MHSRVTVEICVDSVESARAAQRGGAGRVELCSDLWAGGITASAGLIAAVHRCLSIPLHVLIRPRAGDFVYSAEEFDVLKRDVFRARQLGVEGVVFGVLEAGGEVDVARTQQLVEVSHPLAVTFHRAVDATPDLQRALASLKEIGVHRILTAGGVATAEEGLAMLKRLVTDAVDGPVVVAGGGIREFNVARFVREAGVREVHTSLQTGLSLTEAARPGPLGEGDRRARTLSEAEVARFVEAASAG